MKTLTFFSIIASLSFVSCSNTSGENIKEEKETGIPQTEKNSVINSGKEIAENTFKVLGGNLKKAMAEGGVENAINYCNANASFLMDSLGDYYYADIRRTSNKLRNPKNSPTKAEQIVLSKYVGGDEQGPIANALPNGNKVFYAPIKMKPLCVTCHGTVGKTVTEKDYATILKHYPNDKAVDYREGDFRGMWSIELKNNYGKF